MYKLYLQRKTQNRVSDEKIELQVEYILKRGTAAGRGKTWDVNKRRIPPVQKDGFWHFTYELDFTKVRGDRGGQAEYTQWEEMKAMIIQTGSAAKFQQYPWIVIDPQNNATAARIPATAQPAPAQPAAPPENIADIIAQAGEAIADKLLSGVREVGTTLGGVKTWKDLIIPQDFLGAHSDQALGQHPAWKNLYDLGPQVRLLMNNIQRAAETDGESRNHAVLFGHSGCGKTTTLLSFEKMFGEGSVLRLDATSTTKAGLEKMFFNDLTEIPPLVFMEEAEKADPEALKIWLGALDDRGEIRKVNFRVNQLRSLKVLFFCTVNNKALFDKMMGSDGSEAGALSSRCVSQIYFPRPSSDTLRQILKKEIDQHGGKLEWISPALELAQEMGVSDPRIVRHYLAGGDRLLDGGYQRDWKAIQQAQASFRKNS
jgi:energy-coupling factor transporter ATP-binding protein EcfA2